jgi:hypothetical protein
MGEYAGGFTECGRSKDEYGLGTGWYSPGAPVSAADAKLSAAIPADGLDGVLASGYDEVSGDLRLSITAFCAPAKSLETVKVKTKTFQSQGNGDIVGARVSCPGGMQAIGGGASWHEPGEPPRESGGAGPFERAYLSSSTPTRDGRAWLGAGVNGDLITPLVFTVSVTCLPSDQLAKVKRISETRTGPQDNAVGQGAECPGGTALLAGGAYWAEPPFAPRAHHRAVGPPPDEQHSIGQSFPTGPREWFANGYNPAGPSDLTFGVNLLCLTK